MKRNKGFSGELLTALKDSRGIRVRAGTGTHRFIGIWFVLVGTRMFTRSWSLKPQGWYRTFLGEPHGTVQVGKIEIGVGAAPISSKHLLDAIDRAYLKKYNSGWEIKYAKGLTEEKCRAATLELVPSHARTAVLRK
jgi:hypothetical protein